MRKFRVLCSQINHVYGRGAFLPYSVGLLQAYAMKDEVIRSEYEFLTPLFRRERIEDVVQRVGKVDVFAGSCYIWNFNYTMALAKVIKQANPRCLIVLGGPHVPVRSEGFFHQHPYTDLLIHYEGEQTFHEVLLTRIAGEEPFLNRLSQVQGSTVNLADDGSGWLKTPDRKRIDDLDTIPSPYLTGVFDELMGMDYQWLPTWEGTRGCMYACTFCDWGGLTLSKLKKHSDAYLEEEIDWHGKHKIEMIYGADANTGILKRDVHLAEFMVKTKEKYGYPRKFRAAYAKNNVDQVFEINRILSRAGMSKGATLSFQSMDDNVLDLIKRKNIGIDRFADLMKRYNREGIPTYSEIIIGLPGETYESFADGLDTLLNQHAHFGISVYSCECLPNSEMSTPEYREKHGLETVHSPIPFYHGTPHHDPHQEKYELVVATNTLSREDWLRCQLLAWAVQGFHCLGATQALAVYQKHQNGISYRQFYEGLIRFAERNPTTLIGTLYVEARSYFIDVQEGKPLRDLVDLAFGEIAWPPEEWAYLKSVQQRSRFNRELESTGWLDIIELYYQHCLTCAPLDDRPCIEATLHCDFPECIDKWLIGEPCDYVRGLPGATYEFTPVKKYDSLAEFAREVVWYGRKSGGKRVTVTRKEGQA